MKIAILYGLAEGKWHAKQLLPSLEAYNLELTNDPKYADIILCHSAGCYIIPETKANLIVVIGPPFWPKNSITLRILKKTYRDFLMHHSIRELKFWWIKTIHNFYYLLLHLPRWGRMFVNWRREQFPRDPTKRVVVIRNANDKFCQLSGIRKLTRKNNWELIETPGEHDELWIKPDKYVAMILKEYK